MELFRKNVLSMMFNRFLNSFMMVVAIIETSMTKELIHLCSASAYEPKLVARKAL